MARNYNSLGEFATALDRAYKGINPAVEVALRDSMPSLIANIRMRVAGSGVDKNGKQFSTPYSKSHRSKRQKTGSGALGKQIDHKGFFYKGIMWANFQMLSVSNNPPMITAKLGFVGSNTYKSNEELNQIHSDREKIAIAAANPTEAKELTRKIGFAIGEYLNSVL